MAFFLEPDPVNNLFAAGPQVYILHSVPVFTYTLGTLCPITFSQNICKYVKLRKNGCKSPPSPASVNVKFIYQCADLLCLSRSVYCWILARVGIDNRTGTSPHTNKQKTYPSIIFRYFTINKKARRPEKKSWVDGYRSSVSLC